MIYVSLRTLQILFKMKKQRQKQIGIDAVVKVQNFLQTVKDMIQLDERFSINKVAASMHIDNRIATLSLKHGFFEKGVVKGEYKIGESWAANETAAKKLIELVRLSKIEYSEKKMLGELQQKEAEEGVLKKTMDVSVEQAVQLLRRQQKNQIQQGQSKQAGMFDEQEKEFDDKLKIACAIAGGVFSRDQNNLLKNVINKDKDFYINTIVDLTNSLYEKLKDNK